MTIEDIGWGTTLQGYFPGFGLGPLSLVKGNANAL